MKKLGIAIIASMMTSVALMAQPRLEFNKTTHDFGTVPETGGKITGRFEFKNVGNEDLLLTKVAPGCGCTAANYTKTPVKPGESGFIDATYDPYNRPGGFNKNIKVTSNEPKFAEGSSEAPYQIYIKGTVTKRPPTQFESLGYTVGTGMARIKIASNRIELLNTQKLYDTLEVHNFWTKGVKFTLEPIDSYIREVSRTFGEELAPGAEGKIVLEYDGAKRAAIGTFTDLSVFKTTDSLDTDKYIFYNVKISEDFSKLTKKEMKVAPVIVWDTTATIDFGTVVKGGQNKENDFTITNKGKSDLKIHQIQMGGLNVTYKIDKEVLKPGESANIHLAISQSGRKGKQKGTMEVMTNDYKHAVIVVPITAEY